MQTPPKPASTFIANDSALKPRQTVGIAVGRVEVQLPSHSMLCLAVLVARIRPSFQARMCYLGETYVVCDRADVGAQPGSIKSSLLHSGGQSSQVTPATMIGSSPRVQDQSSESILHRCRLPTQSNRKENSTLETPCCYSQA